jgi:Domain of unknown function (DUF2024)
MKFFNVALVTLLAVLGMALYTKSNSTSNSKSNTMQVAVWDTYVPKKDGTVMHFDIRAPSEVRDTTVIYGYGREYLKTKGQEGQPLSAKECRFCHVRSLQPKWEADIKEKGYFVLEMENCN